MRNLYALAILISGAASWGPIWGQGTGPVDCVDGFGIIQGSPITSVGASSAAVYQNNVFGCYDWRVAYYSNGFSAISLIVETAPDSSGSPGSWSTFTAGSDGVNPNTATTFAATRFAGAPAWIRVRLASATGSGSITGVLYGCRQPGCSNGSAGGGGGTSCTLGSPCPVVGTAAAGSAPSGAPVQVGGSDGTNMRTIATDTTGRTVEVGAAAAGAAAAGNPVLEGAKDTSGNAESVRSDVNGGLLAGAYPTNATVSVSASGLTSIITHSGTNTTTVSHLSVSFASGVNFQLEYGTGTNCGTGTTALSGTYQSVAGIALDVPFTVPSGKDLCINLGSSVTGGGLVVYSQP